MPHSSIFICCCTDIEYNWGNFSFKGPYTNHLSSHRSTLPPLPIWNLIPPLHTAFTAWFKDHTVEIAHHGPFPLGLSCWLMDLPKIVYCRNKSPFSKDYCFHMRIFTTIWTTTPHSWSPSYQPPTHWIFLVVISNPTSLGDGSTDLHFYPKRTSFVLL